MRTKISIKIKHDKMMKHAYFDVQINMYRNFAILNFKKVEKLNKRSNQIVEKRKRRHFNFA